MAVPIRSSAKGITLRVFQRRVASFRVAGMALRDISTCFMTCQTVLCGRRNTFATFSEDVLHFFVAGAALWSPPMSFCVAGAAL